MIAGVAVATDQAAHAGGRRVIPLLPLAAGAGAAALGYRTFWWEPRRVGLSFHVLELPFWPAAVDGMRVGVMADLHAGAPHVPIAQVTRLVSWLNREDPDLIVLLGRLRLPARARRPARGAGAGGPVARSALGAAGRVRRARQPRLVGARPGDGRRARRRGHPRAREPCGEDRPAVGGGARRPARARAVDRADVRADPRGRAGARPQPRPRPVPVHPRPRGAHPVRPHPRQPGERAAPAQLRDPVALRHPLRRRPRDRGGTPPVREPRGRHEHAPGALPGCRPRSSCWSCARPGRRGREYLSHCGIAPRRPRQAP